MNLQRGFSSVAEHVAFTEEDGRVYTWGDSTSGALGVGKAVKGSKTKQIHFVDLPGPVVSLGAGEHHTAAVLEDSRLFTWGTNAHGQLGLGKLKQRVWEPTLVPKCQTENFVLVRCGAHYTAALTSDGTLFTWGDGSSGQLGHREDKEACFLPHAVPDLPPIADFSCGWCHMLALTRAGELYVWGYNTNGRLGLGCSSDENLPPTLHPLQGVTRITAGASTSFAVLNSGALLGWGSNSYGNLGVGHVEQLLSPEVLIQEGVLDVAAGGNHSLCLMRDGTVQGWGWNIFGQVVGSRTALTPVPITFLREKKLIPGKEGVAGEGEPRVIGVGCGWVFSFVITEDRAVLIWGGAPTLSPTHVGSSDCPNTVPGLKVMRPKVKMEDEWRELFFWIFLARGDHDSRFWRIPEEVVYHLVWVEFRLQ
jgi:alpha-tubulin suppressor-like RCC1 family protein